MPISLAQVVSPGGVQINRTPDSSFFLTLRVRYYGMRSGRLPVIRTRIN